MVRNTLFVFVSQDSFKANYSSLSSVSLSVCNAFRDLVKSELFSLLGFIHYVNFKAINVIQ